MTRRHFRALAAALAATNASPDTIAAVADVCATTNEHFRRDLFTAAATPVQRP